MTVLKTEYYSSLNMKTGRNGNKDQVVPPFFPVQEGLTPVELQLQFFIAIFNFLKKLLRTLIKFYKLISYS